MSRSYTFFFLPNLGLERKTCSSLLCCCPSERPPAPDLLVLDNCGPSDLVWTVLWAAPSCLDSLPTQSERNHNNQPCLFWFWPSIRKTNFAKCKVQFCPWPQRRGMAFPCLSSWERPWVMEWADSHSIIPGFLIDSFKKEMQFQEELAYNTWD